ncbi:MAG: hypothetical protein V5A23_01055 [Halobacteriales archaeon]
MTDECALTVDGEMLAVGTGLFDETAGRLFWYRGIEDGEVRLEGLNGDVTMGLDRFRGCIREGVLVVESRPAGRPVADR